jgi:hypothetical protein
VRRRQIRLHRSRGRLQLTPHLHLLMPKATWTQSGEETLMPAPDDNEVQKIVLRVLQQAKKEWADEDIKWAEDEFDEMHQVAFNSHSFNNESQVGAME